MRLYVAPNEVDCPRFGISVGKACGNAVIRNRLKRFGRESFRQNQHKIPSGFDYVLIFTQKLTKNKSKGDVKPQNEAAVLTYSQIESRFLNMIQTLDTRGRLKTDD
jgi:ribonuclease P protein component